mmetsp:Transcript_18665/g.27687  ORF Transcript_18665/g.27687 Transcript_18665/m.27687 type:complete len:96 (-) Transcript_18665:431-718(-)
MKKELSDQNVQGKHIDSAAPNDFVRYGLISEFVGRITVIVMRSFSLTCSSGQTISLRNTTNIFFMSDVDFHRTDWELKELVRTANLRGTGVPQRR